MQIFKSCRCNLRLSPTDRRATHDPNWWSVDHHLQPSPERPRKNNLSPDPRQDLRTIG
ncbi:hypothetical protein MTR67_045017 [Solanum verrucosum]|uniref:Uncharacterized protein n=1 Tax=Solanum verrucosum TaxID=315347 RepID=A0AAF0ZTE0_SOLVR|nr:hypothetical protein MTR67_045017 [Solanum verrucosum]